MNNSATRTRGNLKEIAAFYPPQNCRLQILSMCKRLTFCKPFPKQALVFTCLQYNYFENTVGKGEIAHNEQFLLLPQCFLTVWRNFCHARQI